MNLKNIGYTFGLVAILAVSDLSLGQDSNELRPIPRLKDFLLVPDRDISLYQDHWSTELDTRIGKETFEVQASGIVPLYEFDDPSSDFGGFIEADIVKNDDGYESLSVGLVHRWLGENEDVLWGIYGFGDFSRTRDDHSFSQFSLGFDAKTRHGIDFSGNWYWATEQRERVAQRLGQTGSVRIDPNAAQRVNGANLTGTAGLIAEQHEISCRQMVQTGGGALTSDDVAFSRSVFGQFLEGRSGGDFRVSIDLPRISDEFIPAKIYGGVTHYEAGSQGIEEDTSGYAGITFYPGRGVRLGAEYRPDDGYYQDDWLFTAGLSLQTDENFLDVRQWPGFVRNAFSRRTEEEHRIGGDRSYFDVARFDHTTRRSGVRV
ncbi:MAG: hypothetical protein AAF226_17325, partial [Verrucomicrobiota bacterium]